MENIRNFAIVAHVDHGKSTLADRLMEMTGTVSFRDMRAQLLDSNPIERERGITIKLAPVRMEYQGYILNLIDTPGHVDFSYEVSRSLAACEGVLLLVDATQGIQAQTLAHYYQAKKLGLAIIPIINKIDVSTSEVEKTLEQMVSVFGFSPHDVLKVSAKTGIGVDTLINQIIAKIPPPSTQPSALSTVRALVFNSNFDTHLGVVAWVRVVDGEIKTGDKIFLIGSKAATTAIEIGVFVPQRKIIKSLGAGEVGYVVTSLKDISQLTVGDTLSNQLTNNPLPGYSPIKPVVFMSFFPTDGLEINLVRDALGKLKMTDAAMTFTAEHSPALGNGFRIGCLGLLHADIIQERLEREFGLSLIACAPSVSYEILKSDGQIINISKAGDLPDQSFVVEVREPIIKASIFTPENYVGAVMQLCQSHRAVLSDMVYIGKQVSLIYEMPFSELIRQFYDQLKSASSGYASLDYEIMGYFAADLAKLDVLVNDEKVDAFSQIVPKVNVNFIGKGLVEKLQEAIPRQQYEVTIQASVGSKVVARADIKAFRKDVIAKLSGGDQTRKDKLLKKQKKGKARMKSVGRVEIPQEAFLAILKV